MKVEVTCPQCGGKIDFDEESFVIKCDFCGSTLHLVGKDQICHFRLKPRWSQREATRNLFVIFRKKFGSEVKIRKIKLIYAPYWRIYGAVFRWVFGKKMVREPHLSPSAAYKEDTKKLLTKLLDLTFPAFQGVSFGLQSLGVRTSALPLYIFGNVPREPNTVFVKTNTELQYAIKYMNAFVNVGIETEDIEPELEETQEVGEQYSIVYVPFWLVELKKGSKKQVVVLEAISHSSVKRLNRDELVTLKKLLLGSGDSASLPALKFIPFKCPECGWGLPFHPHNSVHICQTCSRGWFEYGGRFHRVKYRVVMPPLNKNKSELVFLPFWKIRMVIKTPDGKVKSISDITGKGYQPYRKALLGSGENAPMHFMVPAFKIKNINAFNKIASRITANPSSYEFEERIEAKKYRFGGVNLTFSEAEEMSRVILLSLIPPFARKAVKELRDAQYEFSNHELLYLPFLEDRLFLRDIHTGFALQKGSVYLNMN